MPWFHQLGPQQVRYVEKSMDYHSRKETAATPPQFTANKAEHDCPGDDNRATPQVDNASKA